MRIHKNGLSNTSLGFHEIQQNNNTKQKFLVIRAGRRLFRVSPLSYGIYYYYLVTYHRKLKAVINKAGTNTKVSVNPK